MTLDWCHWYHCLNHPAVLPYHYYHAPVETPEPTWLSHAPSLAPPHPSPPRSHYHYHRQTKPLLQQTAPLHTPQGCHREAHTIPSGYACNYWDYNHTLLCNERRGVPRCCVPAVCGTNP